MLMVVEVDVLRLGSGGCCCGVVLVFVVLMIFTVVVIWFGCGSCVRHVGFVMVMMMMRRVWLGCSRCRIIRRGRRSRVIVGVVMWVVGLWGCGGSCRWWVMMVRVWREVWRIKEEVIVPVFAVVIARRCRCGRWRCRWRCWG